MKHIAILLLLISIAKAEIQNGTENNLEDLVGQIEEQEEEQTDLLQDLVSEKQKSGTLNILPPDYDKRTIPPQVVEGKVNEIKVTIDIFSIPHLDEKQEVSSQ